MNLTSGYLSLLLKMFLKNNKVLKSVQTINTFLPFGV